MAQYGEWGGPIKKSLGNQTQACLNGSNVNVTRIGCTGVDPSDGSIIIGSEVIEIAQNAFKTCSNLSSVLL